MKRRIFSKNRTLPLLPLVAFALGGCAAEPMTEAEEADDNPFIDAPADLGKADAVTRSLDLSPGLRWLASLDEDQLAEVFAAGTAEAVPLGTNRGTALLPSKRYLVSAVAAVYDGSTWTHEVDGWGEPLFHPNGDPVVTLTDNFAAGITLFEGDVTRGYIADVDVRHGPPSGTSRPHWASPYRRPIEIDGQPSLFVSYQDDPTPIVNRILDEIREIDGCPGLFVGRAHFRGTFRWSYLYYFALDFSDGALCQG